MRQTESQDRLAKRHWNTDQNTDRPEQKSSTHDWTTGIVKPTFCHDCNTIAEQICLIYPSICPAIHPPCRNTANLWRWLQCDHQASPPSPKKCGLDNTSVLPSFLPSILHEHSIPFAMIAMRSPNRSASSIKCVVKIIHRPTFSARIKSHTARREFGSMPGKEAKRETGEGKAITKRWREGQMKWWEREKNEGIWNEEEERSTRMMKMMKSLLFIFSFLSGRDVPDVGSSLQCIRDPNQPRRKEDQRIQPLKGTMKKGKPKTKQKQKQKQK